MTIGNQYIPVVTRPGLVVAHDGQPDAAAHPGAGGVGGFQQQVITAVGRGCRIDHADVAAARGVGFQDDGIPVGRGI